MLQQQLRQARSRLGNYHFASTSQEILRKYVKYPPSLTFHIYDTHYRFNNTQDSNNIPKNSPMAKSFLQHIITEEIPTEMTELLKDFSIRFYDACLILQVYDHRNMVAGEKKETPSPSPKQVQNGDAKAPDLRKPKTYRTLLRPTPLSLYYDLLYHTDSALTKFTDPLSLQMESEILTLTHRKLDLAAPLNPYLLDDFLRPEHTHPTKVWDEKLADWRLVHSHRDETSVEPRKLHEDQLVMHKSSEYEELMFLLSSKYRNPSESTSEKKLVVVGPSSSSHGSSDAVSLEGTPSAGVTAIVTGEKLKRADKPNAINAASSVLSSGNTTANQFMRLRFIEEIRKRKESQKAQAGAVVAAQAQGALPPSAEVPNNGTATMAGINLQRQQQLKQQALAKVMAGQIQQPPQQQMMQQQAQQLQQNQVPQRQQLLQQRNAPQTLQQGMSPTMPQYYNQAGTPRMQQNVRQNVPAQGMPQATQQQVLQQMADQAKLVRAQQFQLQQARQQQMRQNQAQQVPPAKRQKMGGVMGQMPQTQQYQQPVRTPQMGGSQPSSNMGTPVMANGAMATPRMGNMSQPSPQMAQMAQIPQLAQTPVSLQQTSAQLNQRPSTQPVQTGGAGTGQPSTLQQQQQQIFQMTLTPQEQTTFRQLQARMNTLVLMGNTGVAPNRSRLTPQQQQQALQQAKVVQQQLMQRFPTYFQRLRQFQVLQQQRRQAMQQKMQQTQQKLQQGQMGMDNAMYSQQNMGGMNVSLPVMQQQMMNLNMLSQMNNGMQSGQGKNVKRG